MARIVSVEDAKSFLTRSGCDLNIRKQNYNTTTNAAIHNAECAVKKAYIQSLILNTQKEEEHDKLNKCMSIMQKEWDRQYGVKFSPELAKANYVALRNKTPGKPFTSDIEQLPW